MKVPPRLFQGVRRVMERVPAPARRAVTREAWMAYRRGHELTHRLDYLFWESTRRCNLQCVHCGSTCTTEPLPDELTTAEIDDTLAAVARAYDPAGVMLVVTGGEPLVRGDLLEVMERAARRGSPWGMVTNGLLVDDAMIEPLERAGLRTVTVSLDGTEAHHDQIRQRPGSWRAALAALERLNASPYLSIVEAITTVNSINAGDLDELLELLLERGIRYWRIGTVAPIGRAKERPELLADGEQLAAALELVARVRRDRPRVRGGGRLDLSFTCENYVGERFETRVRKHRFACWAGIRTGGIMADGAIGACPDIDRHFIQGNIRDDDLVEVWETGFREFRDRRWMKVGRCEACDSWRQCHGGGLHHFDPAEGANARCHRELLEGDRGNP